MTEVLTPEEAARAARWPRTELRYGTPLALSDEDAKLVAKLQRIADQGKQGEAERKLLEVAEVLSWSSYNARWRVERAQEILAQPEPSRECCDPDNEHADEPLCGDCPDG